MPTNLVWDEGSTNNWTMQMDRLFWMYIMQPNMLIVIELLTVFANLSSSKFTWKKIFLILHHYHSQTIIGARHKRKRNVYPAESEQKYHGTQRETYIFDCWWDWSVDSSS